MPKIFNLKGLVATASTAIITSALILVPMGSVIADNHGKKHHKMKMMDTDGNGDISKDEFMAHAEKKFAKKDANGDGAISADEMRKHCKYNKGKHKKGKSDS